MKISQGVHHVTAITGDAARNVAFYTGVLGLRLVKKTVNFDDPTSYHLYYGDGRGTPGTILTFFAWPGGVRGRNGHGEIGQTALAVPQNSLSFWRARLGEAGVETHESSWNGAPTLEFSDPDGLRLELVESAAFPEAIENAVWTREIGRELAIRGVHHVRADVGNGDLSAQIAREILGWREFSLDNRRFLAPPTQNAGAFWGALEIAENAPNGRAGGGVGQVHHVAFRAEDDAAQREIRAEVARRGLHVSPVMDRNYFESIYFREPNGVLFEIATDGPGFAADEPLESLGEALKLPAQYEPYRASIEANLPSLEV